MRYLGIALAAVVGIGLIGAAELKQTDLLRGGEGEYFAYRTPSVVVTGKGTVIAALCGRKGSVSDFGQIDTLVIRSFDSGQSWTRPQVIAAGGEDAMSNVCTLVDRTTGTTWVFITRISSKARQSEKGGKKALIDGEATMSLWFTQSRDDGATWSEPAELTSKIKHWDASASYHANGPGTGVQLSSGRLVVPRYYRRRGSDVSYAHVIYSDDHGRTWQQGKPTGPYTNENQVVELSDRVLMMNARSYHGKNRRAISISRDGGESWSEPKLDEALIEPVCQASFIEFSKPGLRGKWLLFSNPAATKRENMTIRLSQDGGASWPAAKLLHSGPSAYSSLVQLPDGGIGCLYERGEKSPYEKLTFAKFDVEWLLK